MPAPEETAKRPNAPAGIVVLNWNGWRDTIEAVTAVRASTERDILIYVVDNGSTDGSEAALRAWDPTLTIIQSGGNLGWAGGNNVGIRAALRDGCAEVLLLNNDATPRPNTLKHLREAAQTLPRAAALGAMIVDSRDPGRVEFGGGYIDRRTGMPRQIHGRLETLDIPREPVSIAAVKGCAMLLTSVGLERVGLLTEDYFLNFDETDWCYRARAAGLENYLVAQAVVDHQGAVSFGGTEGPMYGYFIARNRLVFAHRHLDRRGVWFAWRGAFWDFRRALSKTGGRGPGARLRHGATILLAVTDYLRGRLGDCPPLVRAWNRR